MKQLLTGIILMFFITCYLMGNVGHFPLPQFLLLPINAITKHTKDYYLWMNVIAWSVSYLGMYLSLTMMSDPRRPKVAPLPAACVIVAGITTFIDSYDTINYYLPLAIELALLFLGAYNGIQDSKRLYPGCKEHFDQIKKIRKSAKN